jgi:hypothetical protein
MKIKSALWSLCLVLFLGLSFSMEESELSVTKGSSDLLKDDSCKETFNKKFIEHIKSKLNEKTQTEIEDKEKIIFSSFREDLSENLRKKTAQKVNLIELIVKSDIAFRSALFLYLPTWERLQASVKVSKKIKEGNILSEDDRSEYKKLFIEKGRGEMVTVSNLDDTKFFDFFLRQFEKLLRHMSHNILGQDRYAVFSLENEEVKKSLLSEEGALSEKGKEIVMSSFETTFETYTSKEAPSAEKIILQVVNSEEKEKYYQNTKWIRHMNNLLYVVFVSLCFYSFFRFLKDGYNDKTKVYAIRSVFVYSLFLGDVFAPLFSLLVHGGKSYGDAMFIKPLFSFGLKAPKEETKVPHEYYNWQSREKKEVVDA